jgi:hypothetical protein
MKKISPFRPLILLELNEINFSIVKEYISKNPTAFPALQKLMRCKMVYTEAESNYQEIEPWIQWVSVHSGLSYDEHRIFRLGDIAGSGVPQIFDALEHQGLSVGCISPMNAENRLKKAAYFLPDPWTSTSTDGSWWSRVLHRAISQAVNDNAKEKITLRSLIALALGVARFARPKNYVKYLKLLKGVKTEPWGKALFLDLLLHDLHISLLHSRKPKFSCLFLNAGAHIQHHYFLSSQPIKERTSIRNPDWYIGADKDPVRDMLVIYDNIIEEYFKFDDIEFIIATGLSQEPYDRLKFYYRLRDHKNFLERVGIDCVAVYPRMTRDFLIEFSDVTSMRKGVERLRSLRVEQDGILIFQDIEERGKSAFVTLSYPHEITSKTTVVADNVRFQLSSEVVFVALKNGMHSSEGYAFFSRGVTKYAPADRQHVKELYKSMESYFNLK